MMMFLIERSECDDDNVLMMMFLIERSKCDDDDIFYDDVSDRNIRVF